MIKLFLISLIILSNSYTYTAQKVDRSPSVERTIRTPSVEEKRVKIALIDTGVKLTPEIQPFMCINGREDFTGTGIDDDHGHGTNLAHLIAKSLDPKKHCIISLKYYQTGPHSTYNLQNELAAFNRALKLKVKYVNLSSGGNDPSAEETAIIKKLLSSGVRVIVAAGNQGQDLGSNCNYFPACAIKDPNFYVIGNVHDNGSRVWTSNYGGPVRAYRCGVKCKAGGYTMSGTSMSTAIFTGELVREENP